MCLSNDGQALEIFKWGNRALYLLLFLSCMVVMGYWHTRYVFLNVMFLLVVCALTFPMLFYKEEERMKDKNYVCSKCGNSIMVEFEIILWCCGLKMIGKN